MIDVRELESMVAKIQMQLTELSCLKQQLRDATELVQSRFGWLERYASDLETVINAKNYTEAGNVFYRELLRAVAIATEKNELNS